MKKQWMLLSILPLAIMLQAQHHGLYFGANAAYQLTAIANTDDQDLGGELDFASTYKKAYGFDLGYRITSRAGVQAGVMFSEQGQNYITKGNPNANYKTDLKYIKIPALLCYHIIPHRSLSFLAQAGLQLSILTEAKSSRLKAFGIYSPSYVDVEDYYKAMPIEMVLGVGVQYRVSRFTIQCLLRADYSLSDIEVTEKKPGLRAPASNFTLALPQACLQYSFR